MARVAEGLESIAEQHGALRAEKRFHGQACVENAVVDHINFPRSFPSDGRIERFDGTGTA